ncbi:substrate-binding domain-containing protein [Streptomyces africanus]|uniref:substrate-binding domain-containing protein n=1 Tax=Streptomyces africanus TaxID=231024 RepID=UPI000A3600ED|nr:substrate-binding domain-containing protein [Streptomyces africanus]
MTIRLGELFDRPHERQSGEEADRQSDEGPPLTTVVRDARAIARRLAGRVVDMLDEKKVPAEPVRDPLRVQLRESA